VLKSGTWYLVARTARPGAEARIHRVAAIQWLEVLHEPFVPPPRFDLPTWWADATARFEADLYHGTARLRVTEAGLDRLCRFSSRVAEAALANAAPCDWEGWVETEVPIESVDHAARELLRLGDQGEVLGPPELRAKLAAALHQAAARYAR
jgi:predicted DNA-binding transcriptional regulator YafY